MKQILIVDDEYEVASTLGKALRQRGWEPMIVKTAFGALQATKKTLYDAVVLDVNLGGGISGIEVAEKIRSRNGAIRILVFSAVHMGPGVERQIRLLNAAFLEKPVTADRILDLLETRPCE